MITQVTAQGFKGLTFMQPLDRLTLFVGPNGTGKSARTQALTLALLGYIPGSAKKNEDILENFGTGDKFVVGFQAGKDLFDRGYVRSEKGVSQGFKVNAKRVAKDIFIHHLTLAGRPVAFDITAFMDLSAQKKIDSIMDLYPPETDINQIVADIEKSKERINKLEKDKKDAEGAAARLATSRAAMDMPTGTLAELVAQELELEGQLARAQEDLEQAKIGAATEKAREEERAKQPTPETIEAKPETIPVKGETATMDFPRSAPAPRTLAQEPVCGPVSSADRQAPAHPGGLVVPRDSAAASIQAILDALTGAGCSACAARLVAMREFKKYRRVAA
jgi:hypothetical protein